MFLTPKQKPFFGGTYFPKLPRYGVTGLLDLLPRIAEAYYTRGAEIEQQSAAVLESLAARLPSKPTDPFVFSKQLLVDATADLKTGLMLNMEVLVGCQSSFIRPSLNSVCDIIGRPKTK